MDEGKVFWSTLHEQLAAHPGVSAVGATDLLPLGFGVQTRSLEIPGVVSPRSDGEHEVDHSHVSPGFMEAMDIPLLQGRDFAETDVEGGETVAIVSRAFERAFLPEGAVGRSILDNSEPVRIVGVVEDSKVRTIGEDPRPKIFFSTTQQHLPALQFVVRGTGTSQEILQRTLEVAFGIEPDLVLFDQRTMEEQMSVHLFPATHGCTASIDLWGTGAVARCRRHFRSGESRCGTPYP